MLIFSITYFCFAHFVNRELFFFINGGIYSDQKCSSTFDLIFMYTPLHIWTFLVQRGGRVRAWAGYRGQFEDARWEEIRYLRCRSVNNSYNITVGAASQWLSNERMMVYIKLMMVKFSSMMVKWVYHKPISPSLTSISPSLTSILPSLAWSKPSFAHLTIIKKLHRLY